VRSPSNLSGVAEEESDRFESAMSSEVWIQGPSELRRISLQL